MSYCKDGRVDLTDRLTPDSPNRIEWLASKMKRKGVGSTVLFKSLSDVPSGLNMYTIQSWLSGAAKSATWEHWKAVKAAVRAYERRVDLTDRLTPDSPNRIEWLAAEMKRKGVGPRVLFKSLSDVPAGLNAPKIESWIRDKSKAKSATLEHWKAVKNGIRAYERRVDLTDRLTPDSPSRAEWLVSEMKRKGIGYRVLFKSLSDVPAGLNIHTIQSWIKAKGTAKSATWEHWKAVKNGVRAYGQVLSSPPDNTVVRKRRPKPHPSSSPSHLEENNSATTPPASPALSTI